MFTFLIPCPSPQEVDRQLLTTYNVFGIITRLLQQVQYGHDVTILLYPSSSL